MRLRLLTFLLAALSVAACDQARATTPTVPESPVTEAFASSLAVAGASSRTFTAAMAGNVALTLQSVSPSRVIGLGIGIPNTVTGGGCTLARSVTTSGGSTAQITIGVDQGLFCVKVFDVGNLTETVSFTVSIIRP